VKDIAVMDSDGVVRYTVGAHYLEGRDFSWRRYYQEAKEMTVNDDYVIEFIEFKGVEAGKKGIIIAVPMFKTITDVNHSTQSVRFAGVILCTLTLDTLIQKFVAHIKPSKRGHVFLIDNNYNVLWSPDRNLFGKNLMEKTRGFTAFQQIIQKMVAGESGTAEYSYYKFDESVDKYTKEKEEILVAYSPITIGNKLWSIGVVAPKKDPGKLIHAAYNRHQLLVGSTIMIIILGSIYALSLSLRTSKILKYEVDIKTSELRESQSRLEAVKQIGALASSSLYLDKVLQDILNGTLEASGASAGMIFLKDMESKNLRWGASIGLSDAFVSEYKSRNIQTGEGLTGRIAQNGETIFIPRDSSHDARIARPVVVSEGLNSFIGVPIHSAGEIVGVMNILTRAPDTLSEHDISLIVAIGSHVGSAIINAQLFQSCKQAEGALRESEERFRNSFEYAGIGMVITGLDGRYLRVNASMCDIVGYSEEELLKMTFMEITHPDDLEFNRSIVQQLLSGKRNSFNVEKRYIHKHGNIVWVLWNAAVVRNLEGKPMYFIAQIQDITERKGAEEALKKSESRLAESQHIAHIGSWEYNVSENKLWWSEEGYNIFGFNSREVDINYEIFMDRVHSEDREVLEKQVRSGLPYRMDYRIIRPDSEIRYIHEEVRLTQDESGEPKLMWGTAQDITRSKLAEKKIQRYQEQLRTLMSKLSIIEEQERKRISEELHDNISQSLAISKIKLAALQESHPAIAKDLEDTRQLIEQTIKFTRSLIFELSPPILYELGFKAAIEWFTEQVQEKYGVKTEFVSSGKVNELKEEINVLLFKTVRELMFNIVKHAKAQKARVSISSDGDSITVNVEDDGIGFNASMLEQYSIEDKRFGILNIRERIRYLGGIFDVTSKQGKGTRITITVPIIRLKKETMQ
jgi:PAS domain S-box-containing protein